MQQQGPQQKVNLVSPPGRVSFPCVFRPDIFRPGDKPKYRMELLIPKITDIQFIHAAIAQVAQQAFGDMNSFDPAKYPIKDGDTKEYDGYANTWVLALSNQYRPGLIDSNMVEIIDENLFYGGCWARVSFNPFPYGGKDRIKPGVALSLNNIQKLGDDVRFGGGGISAQEEFAGLSVPCVTNIPNQPVPPNAPNQQQGFYQPAQQQAAPPQFQPQQPPNFGGGQPPVSQPQQTWNAQTQQQAAPPLNFGTANPWPESGDGSGNVAPPMNMNGPAGQALQNYEQQRMNK